jgi:hypothetical protein
MPKEVRHSCRTAARVEQRIGLDPCTRVDVPSAGPRRCDIPVARLARVEQRIGLDPCTRVYAPSAGPRRCDIPVARLARVEQRIGLDPCTRVYAPFAGPRRCDIPVARLARVGSFYFPPGLSASQAARTIHPLLSRVASAVASSAPVRSRTMRTARLRSFPFEGFRSIIRLLITLPE